MGGQVSAAKSTLQEEWISKKLQNIKGIQHIWITQWKIIQNSALEEIQQILQTEASKYNEEEDYYQKFNIKIKEP